MTRFVVLASARLPPPDMRLEREPMLISPVGKFSGRDSRSVAPIETAVPPRPLVLDGASESFVIDGDEVRVGSSLACELQLPDGPALHSVIRHQAGVAWIEAVDGANLFVNGQLRRRMALREGDVLELNGSTFAVRFGLTMDSEETTGLVEDLALLTAEELCDRIAAEQALLDEFSADQRAGMRNLVAAIHATHEAEHPTVLLPMETLRPNSAVAATDDCERLFDQIRELSELMHGRTEELDDCESELIAATSLLEEAQERVSQQLEALLDQLQMPPLENELRASA